MDAAQFTQLKNIFMACVNEVNNDERLGDWLIDVGGTLISLGVSLENSEEDED
jgi:hypothetical protein